MSIVADKNSVVIDEILASGESNIAVDISVPIKSGKGVYNVGWKPTAGATVKGDVTLVSPNEGTWDVVAYDALAKKNIATAKGVKAGEKIHFKYKTNFFGVTPEITIEWSEKKDTTVKVHVEIGL